LSLPFAPLLAALAEVRDPRRAQGQRYSLRHLLLFSVLAVLAGAISYQGIITGCVAKFGRGGEWASNTARPGSPHAAVWNRPAMKPAWALMSRPPIIRTCPFLTIAIAS